MAACAPAPIGTVVRYHGSNTNAHGEYVVFGVCACRPDCAARDIAVRTGKLDPDQDRKIRYRLGVIDHRTGGTRSAITHVRRSSFTVLRDAEDISVF